MASNFSVYTGDLFGLILQVFLFLGSLVVVLGASELLGRGLDRLGSRLSLSDEVLGMLTALGADSPEIASAVVALLSGQRDLGVGIVLGSNLFNLAALLGLSALIAGEVAAPVAGTLLNGVVAVAVTLVAGCLVGGLVTPAVSGFLLLLIVLPYLYVVVSGRSNLEFLPLPASWKLLLATSGWDARIESASIGQQNREQPKEDNPDLGSGKSWKPVILILPALAAIVLGSIGLVKSSSAIGSGWLPPAVLGTFVLASLTGLPNSLTAVRLARKARGAAVITETFNSNTINVLVGLTLPALILGVGPHSLLAVVDICWLTFTTVLAVVLTANSARLTRAQGVVLIGCYVGFAATWAFFFRQQ